MFHCFFSVYSPRDLRAPSAYRRDTLPRDRKYVQFYNPGHKIGGGLPKKSWGRKRTELGSTSDSVKLRSRISPERAEFQPPKFSPQSDLRRRAASRWALPRISSLPISHYYRCILHRRTLNARRSYSFQVVRICTDQACCSLVNGNYISQRNTASVAILLLIITKFSASLSAVTI